MPSPSCRLRPSPSLPWAGRGPISMIDQRVRAHWQMAGFGKGASKLRPDACTMMPAALRLRVGVARMREYDVCDQQLNMPKITQELRTATISCDTLPAASRLSCFRVQMAKLGSEKGQFKGSGRGAHTQAEAVFERTDGFVRCKFGPSAFAAGMPEPSLSVMSEIEWAGPLRPPGEVEKKLCTSTLFLK